MPQFTPINGPTKMKRELKDQENADLGPVGGPVQQVKQEAEEGTTEITANDEVDKVSAKLISISKQCLRSYNSDRPTTPKYRPMIVNLFDTEFEIRGQVYGHASQAQQEGCRQ